MIEKIRKILHFKFQKEPKYPLKFYENRKDRFNVNYKNVHLCTCKGNHKEEIQEYFDNTYNGENIYEISNMLKDKYNLKIQKGKTYPRGRGGKKPKKVNYKTAKLCFNPTADGRIQVKVRDKGKAHTVCNCYPNQQEEVAQKYHMLKKNNNLETIKIILKEEYNLRRRK